MKIFEQTKQNYFLWTRPRHVQILTEILSKHLICGMISFTLWCTILYVVDKMSVTPAKSNSVDTAVCNVVLEIISYKYYCVMQPNTTPTQD